ncbi:MAG: hypothetical protein OEV78_06305 [Spirochaetia bacterium]|nr:hypothetical protein [Spirochaetia bacterium]
MVRNFLIYCFIFINILSFDFFYSVDQQTKNIGFCGSSYNETQENEHVNQWFYKLEKSSYKKFIKNFTNDNLKEVNIDISEFKKMTSLFEMPKSQLQSEYTFNHKLKVPDYLLIERLFKPPKTSG